MHVIMIDVVAAAAVATVATASGLTVIGTGTTVTTDGEPWR